ncbi:hypothetical protein ILUMI_26940, partial [Ignelater luminosus]
PSSRRTTEQRSAPIASAERLKELKYELNLIKWGILGICETRRRGEECIALQSRNLLHYKGNNNDSVGGFGLLINKNQIKNIETLTGISDRVIHAKLRLKKLTTIEIMQAYAPTSSYEDEKVTR